VDATRRNPWLDIPAVEYEAHMSSPEVGQLQFLSEVMGKVLRELRPKSLCVLGCTTGNGFEHIDPEITSRVVGVDINSTYLDILKARWSGRLPGLELIGADIASCEIAPASLDLIHCALVFEYVQPAVVLPKVTAWLRPGGVACCVLQLPSEHGPVTETGFTSLRRLEPMMKLVDPVSLKALARDLGLCEIRSWTETLPAGKAFFVGLFRSPRGDDTEAVTS